MLRNSELKLKEALCFPLLVVAGVLSLGLDWTNSLEALGEVGSGGVDPYPESFERREVALALLILGSVCSTSSDSGSRFTIGDNCGGQISAGKSLTCGY